MHRREGKLIVSATDLVGFLACGHLTRLERAQAAGLISKPHREDPEVELLQRRGGEHEGRYIAQLEADGRQVTRLQADWERPYEERAAETIAAMRRGDDVIYQATVFDGRWVGHPDFLLRVTGSSALGDWHYEVADTKLAHSAKAGALVQICSYVDQLERIQDRRPDKVYVVTGGAVIGCHDFRTAEMMAYYAYARERFEKSLDEAISGAPVYPIARADSYPDPVEHCAVCRWYHDFCHRAWRDDDALPLVAGISRRQRGLLGENSVATMLALSQLPPPIQLEGLKRGQAESLWNMREQARLQVASAGLRVPIYELLEPETDSEAALVADRGLAALPEPSVGDLFFDIEGDPFAYWEGLDYLFGIWSGDGQWRSVWAMNRDEEQRAFEQVMDLFMERWAADRNMHIYHYAPYEPTALKRLAGRHGTREEELDQLLRGRVFVDLYRVVRQGLRVGTERYSIKNLEALYGFTREVNLRDANSSIVEFEKILEVGDPDGELKAMIEAYNKDDCVSTQLLRDWLEERRPEVERRFGVQLPRPPIGEPEPPKEEASERTRAIRELESRLTSGLPSRAAERTPQQQATWLLADLLDWHNRERKSTWWRFFELMTLSPEELLEEKEALAGLVYVGPAGQTARGNVIHRYTFPAQEHDVGDNSRLHDPTRPAFEGSGVGSHKIDGANLILDITRPRDWTGPHPLAVVPDNSVGTDAQESALMRIGNWVAENGIDSPLPQYRAARDLLRRLAPRWLGGDGGKLAREGETGTDAARRLVTQLDGTTLPIQGPPGSGKTYTGARMILDLVRAGRRVGITSNSHKVIGNLLKAVCDAAHEAGHPLRAMQKAEKAEVAEHDHVDIQRAPENRHVVQALAAGEVEVAAGTPWLWARDEMEGLVDTLFIDEAGQVSLANVVAVAGAARNVVLLGDPQQLDQPTQGVHPDGAGRSALAHLLDTAETVPPESGLFLEKTWRMHPRITAYTSELFYEGKLDSVEGLEQQRVRGDDWLSGSGLRWVPVTHEGNTNASEAEAERVCEIWQALVGRRWVDAKGREQIIGKDGLVIVSPYNAHRLLLTEKLPDARIGTVDKFQGQEAPVSIYTMASSRSDDAPRGLGFLYSLNRLNVATSRARALAIVVASPALLDAVPKTPDQLRMVNGLCAFVAEATGSQSA